MVFVKALCVVLFLYSARFGASRSPEKEDPCSKKSSLPVVQKSQEDYAKDNAEDLLRAVRTATSTVGRFY